MQGEFPWFSVEDLREGARLATMADHEALVPPAEHSLPNGYFSSEAVGRGLGRRYFDMHGVRIIYHLDGRPDPVATLQAAFGSIPLATGPAVVLGIFVHQGAHYTAMIRRAGVVYHIDSLPVISGKGQYVFEISAELFFQYVQHFSPDRPNPGHARIGGLFSVFYTGAPVA